MDKFSYYLDNPEKDLITGNEYLRTRPSARRWSFDGIDFTYYCVLVFLGLCIIEFAALVLMFVKEAINY